MKRVLTIFVTLFMALALALVMPATTPALADTEETVKIKPAWSTALMIKAPNMVDVGQPFTVTVFAKRSQETAAGASVYALKASDLATAAGGTNYATLMVQYEAAAKNKGFFFGTTGNDGSVTGKFTETGRFVLVAIKGGFEPGFARISATLAAKKGLNIKAPGSIEVNKPVTLSVYERFTQHPVVGAAVYARIIDTLSVPAVSTSGATKAVPAPQGVTATATLSQNVTTSAKSLVPPKVIASSLPLANATVIKADPTNMTAAVQYAAEIKSTGTLLGYTDNNGRLIYTFTDSGVYVLTATSADYVPGLARISVRAGGQGKLFVKSPGSADVGASVTFFVIGRNTDGGIGGASLLALKIDNIQGTAESIWESLMGGSAASEVVEKYRGWAKEKGILLGMSSDSGQVSYVFKESGRYLLVAVKDGYAPGFNHIRIGPVEASGTLAVNVAMNVSAGQPSSIKVWEKASGQPVQAAAIYVMKINDADLTKPMPPVTGSGDAQRQVTISSNWAQERMDKVKKEGVLAGYTDQNGVLSYTFGSSRHYLVAALKDDYFPGFVYTTAGAPEVTTRLYLKAPVEANAGDAIGVAVFDETGKGTGKAAIYSVRMDLLQDVAAVLSALPSSDKAVKEKYGSLVRARSALMGYTDDSGALTVKFSNSGLFMLLAVKEGFIPDFVKINVRAAVILPLPVPSASNTSP